MSRRVWISWSAVVLIAVILTWIALGHTGVSTANQPIVRLIPFTQLGRVSRCMMQDCDWIERAARLLLIDVLGNIVVFMPLGAALYSAIHLNEISRARTILIASTVGILVSLIYEIAQIWIPGRVVASDDIILNTLGTAFGAWGASLLKIRTPRLDSVSLDQ